MNILVQEMKLYLFVVVTVQTLGDKNRKTSKKYGGNLGGDWLGLADLSYTDYDGGHEEWLDLRQIWGQS